MKVFRLLAICLMAAVCAAPLFGQGASATYGNIYGKVTDESGGALPGVSVTLSGGGAARTSDDGRAGGIPVPQPGSREATPSRRSSRVSRPSSART